MQDAYLILEDNTVLPGKSFGVSGTAVGELVFTTAMTGCTESLTDPSYYGQIVIYTFPQLANYGICAADMESEKIHVRGVVVREYCASPSNFRSEQGVGDFLRQHNIMGICGVDTRQLTQRIRERGVVNAIITTELPQNCAAVAELANYRIRQSVEHTTAAAVQVLPPIQAQAPRYSVALLDYGAKKSIADSLRKRGCQVTVYPSSTSAQEILAAGHDGVMLSNGPGDPADNQYCIAQIQQLLGKLPLFGICLGHQMLALAAGATTHKLKFGHRGANQPVRDVQSGRIYITSQNHGYAVDPDSLAGTGALLRYVNVNDGTCEGLDYPQLRAFSMQFHPEAHGGPLDCQSAFARFLALMDGEDIFSPSYQPGKEEEAHA